MREIKFRGYTIEDGSLVIGQLGQDNFGNPRIQQGDQIVAYVVSETVGQYTSLKDKNGVEIYEGDTVELHSGHTAKVVFKEGKFLFIGDPFVVYDDVSSHLIDSTISDCEGSQFDGITTTAQIIGNIHDNE